MSQPANKTGKLKISELAQLTGVSVATIKYYIREGLIQRPATDGRKRSNYGPEYVDRIILIKRLQKERFLPLNVIRKLITTDRSLDKQALGIGMDIPFTEAPAALPLANGSEKELPYPADMIEAIEAEGLIEPWITPEGKVFDPIDTRIISLIKQREEAGLPFDYTLKVMRIYQKHFRKAVQEDIQNFVKYTIAHSEENDLLHYITEGEKTADIFFKLVHTKLARQIIEKRLKANDLISLHVAESLNFRCLEQADTATAAKQPLNLLFLNALQSEVSENAGMPGSHTQADLKMQLVIDGILDLQEGDTAAALTSFESIPDSSMLASLAHVLTGLTHIMKASRSSGLTAFIQGLKAAVSCFEKSQEPSLDPFIFQLTTYFRLVGYSVHPDIFDINEKTLREYDTLKNGHQAFFSDDSNQTDNLLLQFRQELITKAHYFLVLMYRSCDELDKADQMLAEIVASGRNTFYTRWAHKKMKK